MIFNQELAFIGCFNYINNFDQNLAADREILQKQLRKKSTGLDENSMESLRKRRNNVPNFPPFKRPGNFKLILQTDASDMMITVPRDMI